MRWTLCVVLAIGVLPVTRLHAEIEPIAVQTGDGTKLRTFGFFPKAAQGHWELVAYGREPEYVLMFCISATSKVALEKYRPAFLTMVRSYTSRDEP